MAAGLEVQGLQLPGEAHDGRKRPLRPAIRDEQQQVHQQQDDRQGQQAEVEREVGHARFIEYQVEALVAVIGDVHQAVDAVHVDATESGAEILESAR